MASGMHATLVLANVGTRGRQAATATRSSLAEEGEKAMTYEDIEVTRYGDVELITLNRPDVRNA